MTTASLGIDIGTTAIKLILVSSDGEVLGTWTMGHDLHSPRQGFAEEDTETWKANLYQLLAQVVSEVDTSCIKAVGVTGMVPTLIALDEQYRPLMPSIQQNDIRAVAEIVELEKKLEPRWFFEHTGNKVNQQHIFPKLLWLRRNRPEMYKQTRHVMGSYDYISFLLTGTPHVERNWALESGMWDIKNGDWLQEVLEAADIDQRLLPPVYGPTDIIGTTTTALRDETGLPAGIPVVAGTADHVASSFCTGAREPGDLVLKLGGAGDILLALDKLKTDPRMFIDYGCSTHVPFLLNGCTASSGSMLKWFQTQCSLPDFVLMDEAAKQIPPGSEGVVILPYLLGEKTPLFDVEAKGVVYGLTLSHTRDHVYRAMLEAVAFSFRHHLQVFEELGLPVNHVFITNGGSKSTLWRSIMADVVGHDLRYIKNNPGSCLGAALLGGIGTGIMTEAVADRFLEQYVDIPHSEENHRLYEGCFATYRSIYEALKPVMHGHPVAGFSAL